MYRYRYGIFGFCRVVGGLHYKDAVLFENSWRSDHRKIAIFATMSHKIRTPMNGILGMVDLLESSELTLDQQLTVRTVKHSSNALVRIIDDVLDLAKLEAAKLELRMEPAQLLPFLESAIDSFRAYAATKNVILICWYDPDLPNWVTCGVSRLRQIVLNLLMKIIPLKTRLSSTRALPRLIGKYGRSHPIWSSLSQ
jgi:signal transduction histidine kinase